MAPPPSNLLAPCYVLGVGMTPFTKPSPTTTYTSLAFTGGAKALLDAHLTYDDIQAGVAAYVFGDSTCGQRVFYQFGTTGIPIFNVNNNCSTGSTGLFLARNMIATGAYDCVLVIGFEKMARGPLGAGAWKDRASPLEVFESAMRNSRGITNSPQNAQYFGNAGKEYMEKYGAEARDFAEVGRINHEHGSRNPYAQFRDVYSMEQILGSGMIYEPLTKLQCSATSDGAAAAVLCSEAFLKKRKELRGQAVRIAGQALRTDVKGVFDGSAMELVGAGMTVVAGKAALAEAGVDVEDVKVVELHDCFSANEVVVLDALGLCEKGKAHEMVRRGDITYGGKRVVNPSGGLISKGHPLGATGLAQCAELTWHLRGWANNRLVDGTDVCLQHNLGLGGAVVVTVYKRADGGFAKKVDSSEVAKLTGLGFNPAVEARPLSNEQAEAVRSKEHADAKAFQGTLENVVARL